ncbi:odorant-binding protein 2a-like [Meriones unguiculatus]|uniref:odorant-binding protein 2a-like n=1 Tax=Meriones unguiculatus TaxID=10047 RepID=UPI000B4F8B7E|nr:odorant-binding protein 2a-like [Meriones unguiculatus]XP_060246497.1 odorant-binding protein 2a-like [Meriones unguiculatus]
MKSLLLTVLLLGLVAVLKAQEDLPDDKEDFSGTWYTNAMVCDKDHTNGKKPKKVYLMTVTALEGGDLEITITFQKNGQCHEKKIVIHKTDDPHKFTAFGGKKVIQIQATSQKDHYILYCEGKHKGKLHRKAKLLGRKPEKSPEAMREFMEFVESKKLKTQNIIVPEQMGQCTPESD